VNGRGVRGEGILRRRNPLLSLRDILSHKWERRNNEFFIFRVSTCKK